MGDDFYTSDYGGDFYGGGGGSGVGGSYDLGGDFLYGYGQGDSSAPIDWGFDTTSWPTLGQAGDIGAGSDFNYGYGVGSDSGPVADQAWFDTGLWQQGSETGQAGNDTFEAYLDYYIGLGYDALTAADLAANETENVSIRTETYVPELPPSLPAIQTPSVTGSPLYQYWQAPSYIPTFPDLPPPAPPPSLPLSPASSQPGLPPACPGGQYHPYPIGHPSQNICVPFPAATTNQQQQQKPPSSVPAATAPKSPSQQTQQCPQGYYKAPTGQCLPIPRCTSPGTVYDQRSGRCVPAGQALSPGCPPGEWFNPQSRRCEPTPVCATPGTVFDVNRGLCVTPDQLSSGEDIFGGLKNIPWWLWAAAGLLLFLGSDDDNKGRKTTVYHRRAT